MKNMTFTILFAGTCPDIGIGYSKGANFITNTLAAIPSVKVFHFAFSNFPSNPKVSRKIHPNISFIDVHDEESKLNPNVYDDYGTNILVDTLKRVKADLLFLYNDIVVISRLFNKLAENDNRKSIGNFRIITFLDLVYDYQRPELLKHVFNFSDKVIVFADHWLRNLVDMGFPKEQMDVLYHTHNLSTILDVSESKRQFNFPVDSFVILNANRNSYRKALDITIRAFLLFLKSQNMNPRIYLLLRTSLDQTSGFNILNIIQTECIRNKMDYSIVINHHIHTVGKNENLSDETMLSLYNACEVGMNTCIGEGFGLCNVEHGILGKPQVVSKVASLADIFSEMTDTNITPRTSYHVSNTQDFHNGVAYVCDATDVALGLTKVYENYDFYCKQFAKFRETALVKYSEDTVKTKLIQIMTPFLEDHITH